MFVNESSFDRATRMSLGIAMLALGLSGTVAGFTGIVLVFIGATALVTGTVGRCPFYSAMGWSTVRHQA